MQQEKLKNIDLTFQCGVKDSEFETKNGKPFCTRCKTTVHDLSQATNEDIKALFKDSDTICGSFYNDQLETPYQIYKNRNTKKWAFGSLLGAFTVLITPTNAVAQAPAIEQTDSLYKGDRVNFEPEAVLPEIEETEKKYKKGYIDLFRIGYRHVTLDKRFPFIHTRRRLRGKIAYHKSVRYL